MPGSTHIYAVLTGDLVKSSRLSPEKSYAAMARIRELGREFEGAHGGATIGEVDTFRHDSWQWLLAEPVLALRAAVFMRAGVRSLSHGATKLDTRIAIAIGPTETISKRRLSDSRGPVFTLSGKTLDAMKKGRLAYAGGDDFDGTAGWLSDVVVPLVDCIVTDWTAAEARAVHGALLGLTQEQTAWRWPVVKATGKRPTRQAVAKALAGAHWTTLKSVLEAVAKRLKPPSVVASIESNLRGLLRPGNKPGAISDGGGGSKA